MLFNFVLVWLYKYFDMSVTNESYVDESTSGILNYNPGTSDNYLHTTQGLGDIFCNLFHKIMF